MLYYRNPIDPTIIDTLKQLLADTYLLYIQTQGAHWNVIGQGFPQLHALFQTQYEELRDAVDVIAELIRIYGDVSPATAKDFIRLASFDEFPTSEDPEELIDGLLESNIATQATAKKLTAETVEYLDIQNLAIDRISAHGKAIWMLRSTHSI